MIKLTSFVFPWAFMFHEGTLLSSKFSFKCLRFSFSDFHMLSVYLRTATLWVAAHLHQRLLCLGFSLTPKKVSITVCLCGAAHKQSSSRNRVRFPWVPPEHQLLWLKAKAKTQVPQHAWPLESNADREMSRSPDSVIFCISMKLFILWVISL